MSNIFAKTSQFPANVRKLFKRDKDRFASAEELENLRLAQTECERLAKHVEASSHERARNAVKELRSRYLKSPSDEAFKELSDAVQSREEIEAQFRDLRRVAKDAMRDYYRTVVCPLCLPVLERVADRTAKKAEAIEAAERAAAESVDVPFVESETLLAVRTKERDLRARIENLRSPIGYGDVRGVIGDYVEL